MSLIGNKPNQVPSNGDLGTMAFQNFDDMFAFGAYTPTVSNTTNVASSSTFEVDFMRIGNVVTCAMRVNFTPTAGNTYTELELTLPIPSNFSGAQTILTGSGGATTGTQAVSAVRVLGKNSATGAVLVQFVCGASTSANALFGTFVYKIR